MGLDLFPKENIYLQRQKGILYQGDVLEILKRLPDESVDCIITSPPYWGLRDYGVEEQIGLEKTLEEYLEKLLQITIELKRILKKTGVMFWNHGDSYNGSQGHFNAKNPKAREGKLIPDWINYPKKCMHLQNYRLILKMIDEQGWILRNIVIWYKPNHLPSSVKDRFTNAYEPVFMLVKSRKYWFDLNAVRVSHKTDAVNKLRDKSQEPYNNSFPGGHFSPGERPEGHSLGKNPGDLWVIPTQPFPEAHFATFPEKLVRPMIKAGCPQWICKKCGKIRERIIDKSYIPTRPGVNTGKGKSGTDLDPNQSFHRRDITKYRMKIEYNVIGWTDCGCNADWEAGIVLDPFMGSGTVAKVAEELGRKWIGIELNPKYCGIVEKRLSEVPNKTFV